MFYSHQLLARKAPLGQIWMAATIKAKINRRKLDKLDIIQICEEILNPSVPMALRLSGILMGGVVIVYERKVKLLYDDVTRFLVEINEAWKIKPNVDRTVLPRGKAQAKFEAVTLPEAAADADGEQTMHFFSDASTAAARFQSMRLDDLDEHFINISPRDEEQSEQKHQADAANITLFDDFGSGLAETDLYNRFERFDIGEDEDIQMNFTSQEHPTLVPSPPREEAQPQPPTSHVSSPPTHHETAAHSEPMADEQEERQPKEHTNVVQEQAEGAEPEPRQQPSRRRARRKLPRIILDDEQIMIPGNIYQMWLQDASSIISKRARKTKPQHPIATTKVSILMDLPPLALMTGLDNFPSELHYPAPLLKLWRKCTGAMPAHGSPSDDNASRVNRQSSVSHSPPVTLSRGNNINPEFPPGDFQSEVGSQPEVSPIEKARAQQANLEFQAIFNDADMAASDHFTTPRSPAGHSSGSIPSSGSGHTFLPHEREVLPTSARYKKRQHSSARSDLGNLDPVEEEIPVVQDVRGFKIRRLSEIRPPYDSELLEETVPTQTPRPVATEPTVDKVTQSIRTHLKMHFDTPGNPQSESIDQLASGMTRKKAAQLFYQTCVLATLDFVRVHQAEAYAEILISRGPKM